MGGFNISGTLSQTYDLEEGTYQFGWNIGAGFGSGNAEKGIGINVSYGSNGWSLGLGGFYDWHAWDDNPVYEPEKWNDYKEKMENNNCYSYALDDIDNGVFHGLQPGYYGGIAITQENINLEYIKNAALSDGRIKKPTLLNKMGFGKKGYYPVYLVIDEGVDYHWYRQDKGGLWSQKHGGWLVENVDGSGRTIKKP